jgi:hypothetical protein
MAIQVNPPPFLRIPRAFIADPEVNAFIKQQNIILFQLWNRSGGDEDATDGNKQGLTSTSSRVSKNAAVINSIALKSFEIIPTTESLTTKEFQIIICKNTESIDITLNPEAIEDDEVHIKRRGRSINVIGSIDGFTNKTINVLNYSMHLVFDGTDWSEI